MANLQDVLKSFQSAQALMHAYSNASGISEMLQTQENLVNNYGIGKINVDWNKSNSRYLSIAEAIKPIKPLVFNQDSTFWNPMAKSLLSAMSLHTKFFISDSAIEVIRSINEKQQQLFGNFRSISDAIRPSAVKASQLNTLGSALFGISAQLTAFAVTQNRWELLNEYNNISRQALEISIRPADVQMTEQESKVLENLIAHILTFIKSNKKFGTKVLLFLSVIVNIMAIHQYIDFVSKKPAPATKEDLVRFESKILQVITEKLKEQKEIRILNRNCKVFLNSKSRTIVIEILPIDYQVILIQTNHKWAYVSYVSAADNHPKIGWILKKYLERP